VALVVQILLIYLLHFLEILEVLVEVEKEEKKRGEDLIHQLQVTLEDLYNGKKTKLQVTKDVICKECKGSGAEKEGANVKCKTCDGKGIRILTQRMGMFVQQMQTVCHDCQGKGEIIKEEDKCKKCKGQKVVKQKKLLEVEIDKGMSHGQKVVFSGESDQSPGVEPGDIIIVLVQKRHEKYHRSGSDLQVEQEINLVEALCGTTFHLKHLDDRVLVIKSEVGNVIKPGDVKMIVEEGMPKPKDPINKGNLYIKFSIIFPDSMDKSKVSSLEKLLSPPRPTLPKLSSDVVIENVTLGQSLENGEKHGGHGHSHGGTNSDENNSDEEGRGGNNGGVECRQS